MKNFIQNGDTITLTAPYNITSGSGVLVGAIFGIACNDALVNTEVEVKLSGVFATDKVVAEIWSVGSLVYWNDIEKLVTAVSNNNHPIGVAIAHSANSSRMGIVRLNGVSLNININTIDYNVQSAILTNSTNTKRL